MTPMERFLNLIVTEPSRIPFSHEENRNENRQAVAYWQRAEGMDTTVAVQGPLDVIHPQAAGIDVGNAYHDVAVRPDRDTEPVRQFGCFTAICIGWRTG
jgi:hypothetical protein